MRRSFNIEVEYIPSSVTSSLHMGGSSSCSSIAAPQVVQIDYVSDAAARQITGAVTDGIYTSFVQAAILTTSVVGTVYCGFRVGKWIGGVLGAFMRLVQRCI
jgi:hypothetical protein